jgi:L-threonylcarbamoyladenylate synthase
MRLFPITDESIALALEVLRDGGVVAHATETCYGLACDLSNPVAVHKTFAIKRRPLTQPISALFPSAQEAKRFVEWTPQADTLAAAHLPGPFTMVLPLRADAPARLLATPDGHPTVGVRVSSHPLATALVTAFGSPLSTTSANIHGQPNPYSAAAVIAQFAGLADAPDIILDSGELPQTPPSTIVDLTAQDPKILRNGPVTGL